MGTTGLNVTYTTKEELNLLEFPFTGKEKEWWTPTSELVTERALFEQIVHGLPKKYETSRVWATIISHKFK
jgi:hypothetical protein